MIIKHHVQSISIYLKFLTLLILSLCNLKFYGVICTPLKLVDNYFRNRHQFVKFKNNNSDLQEILTGISQGSVIGPLFFCIYINNLIKSINKCKYFIMSLTQLSTLYLEDLKFVTMNCDINSFWGKMMSCLRSTS